MDLLQIGLGFLLGIIGAGFGVVLEQGIIDRRRRAAQLHALRAEIRENMRRLKGPVVKDVSGATVVRIAWDAARSLDMSDEVFGTIAEAYRHAAELERFAGFILLRVAIKGHAWRGFLEHRARTDLERVAIAHGQASYDAFAAALGLLSS